MSHFPSIPEMPGHAAVSFIIYGIASIIALPPFLKFGPHIWTEGILDFCVGSLYGKVASMILFVEAGVFAHILPSFLEVLIPCAAGGLAPGQVRHHGNKCART